MEQIGSDPVDDGALNLRTSVQGTRLCAGRKEEGGLLRVHRGGTGALLSLQTPSPEVYGEEGEAHLNYRAKRESTVRA